MQKSKKQVRTHRPVLVSEVNRALKLKELAHLKSQARVIDATVGVGGHSSELVKAGVFVLGIDADPEMSIIAKERLTEACPPPLDRRKSAATSRGCFKLLLGNFKDIGKLSKLAGIDNVNGVIFDLGQTSIQLTSKERGFSFSHPKSQLDMRLNPKVQKITASDLLNSLREDQLRDLFEKTLRIDEARKIAKEIIKRRPDRPFRKVSDFLEVSEKLIRPKANIHPATRPFLAVRIAVNSELVNLAESLPKAFGLLKKTGRLAVISFHSGEDSIVKNFYKEQKKQNMARIITKKPIVPSPEEIQANFRARSAKLRVLEKL